MLTIEYDPINGVAVPDGQAEAFASDTIKFHQSSPRDETVVVGVGIAVDAFRVMTVRKLIHHSEIQFKFKDQTIEADEYASLKPWPVGFCDKLSDYVREIGRARRASRTQ